MWKGGEGGNQLYNDVFEEKTDVECTPVRVCLRVLLQTPGKGGYRAGACRVATRGV